MCAASVSSVRKNFRRAGRLKKSWRTSMLVPGALPAALTSAILPPLMMICVPSGESFSRSRVVSVKRLTLAMLGNGFAAKTHRGDGRQIFGALNFAGGVAFEAEQRVVAAHAEAVVGHANETASARADFDGDFFRVGVERIFDQLLHDAGGPFDHFAGGDLVGDLFGKELDAVHLSLKR